MDSPVGRYRAEWLLRSAHHEIDKGSGNSQKAWDAISYSCKKLWDCVIFYNHLEKEIMHRTSPTSYSLHLWPVIPQTSTLFKTKLPSSSKGCSRLLLHHVHWVDRYHSSLFESTKPLLLYSLSSKLTWHYQSTTSGLDQEAQVCFSPLRHWICYMQRVILVLGARNQVVHPSWQDHGGDMQWFRRGRGIGWRMR